MSQAQPRRSIVMSDEVWGALHKLAVDRATSTSALVREAALDLLAKYEREPLTPKKKTRTSK